MPRSILGYVNLAVICLCSSIFVWYIRSTYIFHTFLYHFTFAAACFRNQSMCRVLSVAWSPLRKFWTETATTLTLWLLPNQGPITNFSSPKSIFRFLIRIKNQISAALYTSHTPVSPRSLSSYICRFLFSSDFP
jgi:hypothetical protein